MPHSLGWVAVWALEERGVEHDEVEDLVAMRKSNCRHSDGQVLVVDCMMVSLCPPVQQLNARAVDAIWPRDYA
jgi:hypothetical protein